jgi:LysM repeat protein
MSNPNPFVPKGSLLEQQSKRRSHLKIAVSCVLAVGIVGLVAMLIQGCKRNDNGDNTTADNNPPPIEQDTNAPAVDTNAPAINPPIAEAPGGSNAVPTAPAPPVAPVVPVPAPAVEPTPAPAPAEVSGSEYVVVSGDTLAKIAKKNGVSLKALEAANPDVNPKHLKVKQKLVIPAGGTSSGAAAPLVSSDNTSAVDTGSETTYTVKSGDTLHRIAKRFGTTVKAIEAENNLSTSKIKVGQKLKIPAKAEAAPAAPAPVAPAPEPPAAPVSQVPPVPAPVTTPNAPASPSGT